jgi:hypothetical protein
VLFTPLYLSNFCTNGCRYCSFSHDNRIARLQECYPDTEISVSLPRIRPHMGGFQPACPVEDRYIVQIMTALRLFMPRLGITISTRESARFRDRLLPLGVTRMSGVSTEMVDLISRLVNLIPWPERRRAMGDVTLVLLDGKHRVAEDVFGWGRSAVEVGIKEYQTGISCVNDISMRGKPKTEKKNPELLADIRAIMEPYSENDSRLRTTLLYTNMTAKAVYAALIEKGWSANHCRSCARFQTS